MTEAEKIANKLNMLPHPEGGYYKETYRSDGEITPNILGTDFTGKRNYSTCIYFLLTSDTFSAFHRIKQDEIWHFYKGAPIMLHIISEKGNYSNVIIGNDLENNEFPQYIVKAKNWFAAEVIGNSTYSLLGCTVSPGFDFKDFELAERAALTSKFPEQKTIIEKLTRINN
ncbi:cupin domain-containing protein [Tamlana sp. 2201CG12-4]|uniref:cupin domain-containing protein n=1 Tax=Tamlana sp. 2201CG12-4 TaxID=3112582 RepID=UPI002DB5EE33|nr:cupin domain-containing protein [Tamlana sp. 2201CG12-4]MEC3907296.1 cupin domain-containing protein [Tamlana sp. 2201CG12-4]